MVRVRTLVAAQMDLEKVCRMLYASASGVGTRTSSSRPPSFSLHGTRQLSRPTSCAVSRRFHTALNISSVVMSSSAVSICAAALAR